MGFTKLNIGVNSLRGPKICISESLSSVEFLIAETVIYDTEANALGG